jgi:integrase
MPEITIGRLRGGFCVHWVGPDGKRRRHQLAARTAKEAEAEGRDRFLKETAPVTGRTVADLWVAYIDHLGTRPTAKTLRYTGKAVLAHFGALRPDQINLADCRAYTAQRMASGIAQGSVHTELGHLRSALIWAVKARLIANAPHIERPSKPDSDVRPLTEAESLALIRGCNAPHVALAVVLLFGTAARIGAILDLTWDRVDFERGVINLRLPDGVTRKGRAVVPMNRMTRAALQTAYAARLTDYVVEWAGGRVSKIRKGFAAALERGDLSGITIHQIRHTAAVRMLSNGVPLSQVSQLLGHSDERVTAKVYARFLPEHLATAAEVLDLDWFTEPRSTSQRGAKSIEIRWWAMTGSNRRHLRCKQCGPSPSY